MTPLPLIPGGDDPLSKLEVQARALVGVSDMALAPDVVLAMVGCIRELAKGYVDEGYDASVPADIIAKWLG